MKKIMFKGMALLTMGFAFAACSHESVYDEKHVEKEKVANYQQAFEQAFGKIAAGNDWGFGTVAATRGSATMGFDQYDVSGLHKPINGSKKVDAFIAAFNKAEVVTDVDFSDYFLQHVIKQTNKGNIGWGTKDQHHQMAQLQAFNYNTSEWEDVENFEGGKNVKQFIANNNETKGTTLMVNMGTPDTSVNPQFRWIAKKNAEVGEGYECSNYVIKKVDGQYYLGMSYVNKPENASNSSSEAYNNYDAWIIRLVKAVGNPGYKAYGRIMCEDLGSTQASDLDFNDVVFDAYILNDGSINISILAAGGKLRPVTVAGVEVKLKQMSNTGYNDITDDVQEFTISAAVANANGWTSLDKIPVEVTNADGTKIALEAKSDGSAPSKVCTYVGVQWAKEKTKLNEAYFNWTTYVTTTNPKIWFENMDGSKVVSQFFEVTEIVSD